MLCQTCGTEFRIARVGQIPTYCDKRCWERDPNRAAEELERKRLSGARSKQRLRERRATDPEFDALWRSRRRAKEKRRHLVRMATDPEYAQLHVLKLRAYRKTWKARHHDAREQHLRDHYGIGRADYDRMLAEQGGRCAICGGPPVRREVFDVDHDHQRGTIRGLLCFPCNNGLGCFRDDAERLSAAIVYLDGHHQRDESAA